MQWYIGVLKKYATFSGRARRKEYWMFVLFNFIVSIGFAVLDMVLGTVTDTGQLILNSIYSLAVFLPGLGVSVRRLHDTGRSGFWLLIAFLPCIGALILLFFLCEDSHGSNQYGEPPKLTAE